MEKIKAKVEQVLHKDTTHASHTTGTTHTDTHTGTHTGVGGHTGTTGVTGTHHSDPSGPHDTHTGNKIDPRVDSTIPGPAGNTTGHGTTGLGHSTHQTTGGLGSNTHSTGGGYSNTSGLGHSTGNTHAHSDPSGPHDSKLANKLDPRVDSTVPGPQGNSGGARDIHGNTSTHQSGGLTGGTTGAYGSTTGSGLTGSHTGPGLGHTGHQTGAGLGHSGTHGYSDPSGPHDSRLANSADPRIDHDRDNSATIGGTGPGLGHTGHQTGAGLTGHSTTTHQGGLTGGLTGGYSDNTTHSTHAGTGLGHSNAGVGHLPGPADKTAGPHKSDALNKLDPRIDSDLDGSKTVGGNPTYR